MTLGRVYALMPDQKKSMSAARAVFKIIDRKSKIDSLSEEGLKPETVIGNIRFENVRFNYPNRPNIKILQGLTLDCKKGETNALVGPSGKKEFYLVYHGKFNLIKSIKKDVVRVRPYRYYSDSSTPIVERSIWMVSILRS